MLKVVDPFLIVDGQEGQVMHNALRQVRGQVFAGELSTTTGEVEVAVHGTERAIAAHVSLKVLTLGIHTTPVWARHWAKPTRGPVFSHYTLIVSIIVTAVVAAERSPGTLFNFMDCNALTWKIFGALTTLKLRVWTPPELITWLRTLVQMALKFSQFPRPLAAFSLM